jgi:5-methylcytosine-specific restriction enzyme A
MPTKPKAICPKCGTVRSGPCPKCGTGKRGWASDQFRGNRHARGYDNAWVKLREAKKAANPLCEECERNGHVTEMEEVHHIIAFHGVDDPMRLKWSNLESLCKACHGKKTRERNRG